MLDIKFLLPKVDEEYAYKMGYDCTVNGPTTENCHFSIFSSKENTRAWEKGKADGEKEPPHPDSHDVREMRDQCEGEEEGNG